MNILVIGNGFDLAHGLPTTYKDFLTFAQVYTIYRQLCMEEQINIESVKLEDKDRVLFLAALHKREPQIFDELGRLLDGNVWVKYFWSLYENQKMMGKDGWIDFEKEISKVIQTIDRVNRKIKSEEKVDDISPDDKQLLNFFEMDIRKILKVGIEENKTKFLADLNRLTRSLEIYLAYYVGRMNPEIRLSDIENLDIQRVLSFNYTDTYEKLYDTNESNI